MLKTLAVASYRLRQLLHIQRSKNLTELHKLSGLRVAHTDGIP